MGIHIGNLNVNPQLVTSSENTCTLSFRAFNDDQDLTVTFGLRIGVHPDVYLKNSDGAKMKEIDIRRKITTQSVKYEQEITVIVENTPSYNIDIGLELYKKKPAEGGVANGYMNYVPPDSKLRTLSKNGKLKMRKALREHFRK